jgi:alkaline phosphatase D
MMRSRNQRYKIMNCRACAIALFILLMRSHSIQSQCMPENYVFQHGVASGDATNEAVIIWTRLTLQEQTSSEKLQWFVATDASMHNIISQGEVYTDASKDFTVKVDVDNLAADTWYYYRFEWRGIRSEVGRTHTLPLESESFAFAAFSCANYESGFFHAYREAAMRNDIQAVVHLGDYFYEYAPGSSISGRIHQPGHTLYTLEDYRIRHAQICLDPDAQLLREQYPWYVIWDDHEFANDAWSGGAPGHDNSILSWEERKASAIQAYFEWMPIRKGGTNSIYRQFVLPALANIIFIDSRMEGRSEQVPLNSDLLNDSTRSIMGDEQFLWLKETLINADSGDWNILINSVMMNRAVYAGGEPIDNDIWEGYRFERDSLFRFIKNSEIRKCISIAGDYHSSWAGEMALPEYDKQEQTGSVGVEISVCATSSTPHSIGDTASFMSINPHLEWIDQTHNGYLLCKVTKEKFSSQWIYVSTVQQDDYEVISGQTIEVPDQIPFLVKHSGDLQLNTNSAQLLTDQFLPGQASALVSDMRIFPNPANQLATLFWEGMCGEVQLTVIDVSGRIIHQRQITSFPPVLLDTKDIASGLYIVEFSSPGSHEAQRLIIEHRY